MTIFLVLPSLDCKLSTIDCPVCAIPDVDAGFRPFRSIWSRFTDLTIPTTEDTILEDDKTMSEKGEGTRFIGHQKLKIKDKQKISRINYKIYSLNS